MMKYKKKYNNLERFEEKFVPHENGCWIWIAGISNVGYGLFNLGGCMGAHRASWILYRGPIPEGLCVCHKCDVKPCVNPNHLFLGTQSDNMRDAVAKGHMPDNSMENHGGAKLKSAQVRIILARYADGGISIRALATEYKVDHSTIWAVINRKTWKKL